MKKNRIFKLLTLTCAITLICTGCQNPFIRGIEAKSYQTEQIKANQLEDGGFYVKKVKKNKYEKLYAENASFETGKTSSSVNDKRVLWFKNDYVKVPTMYKGDSLIYHYTDVFEDQFIVERFEDVGYTLGMCNLTQTLSGRYSLSLSSSDKTIEPDSDVSTLYGLEIDSVIVDKLGEDELRAANISRGGTITNLKKDAVYETYIYTGTDEHIYNFKADVKAFVSMEAYKLVDYDFYKKTMLKINFPDYFNSGYYYINGYGLVRYINMPEDEAPDIENIDFNVPNTVPDESNEEESTEEMEFDASQGNNSQSYSISTASNGDKTVVVSYGNVPASYDNGEGVPDVTAKIIGNNGVWELTNNGDGTLSATFPTVANEAYILTVDNIYGRSIDVSTQKPQE